MVFLKFQLDLLNIRPILFFFYVFSDLSKRNFFRKKLTISLSQEFSKCVFGLCLSSLSHRKVLSHCNQDKAFNIWFNLFLCPKHILIHISGSFHALGTAVTLTWSIVFDAIHVGPWIHVCLCHFLSRLLTQLLLHLTCLSICSFSPPSCFCLFLWAFAPDISKKQLPLFSFSGTNLRLSPHGRRCFLFRPVRDGDAIFRDFTCCSSCWMFITNSLSSNSLISFFFERKTFCITELSRRPFVLS